MTSNIIRVFNIMKTFVMIVTVLFITSCKSTDNTHFDNFVGTWVPIELQHNRPIVLKMQIEKRDNLYLIAVRNLGGRDIDFLIGKANKDHILVTPSQSLHDGDEACLSRPSDMYYDVGLKSIFFLNTMYISSDQKIFEIKNNNIIIVEKD